MPDAFIGDRSGNGKSLLVLLLVETLTWLLADITAHDSRRSG